MRTRPWASRRNAAATSSVASVPAPARRPPASAVERWIAATSGARIAS
ncbi:MAG TPA: hypothetical protein VHT91_16310 [Kofleriaceae bacterium]|nr:hypothetical protein [Kofleriaceae bacterium]